MSGTVSKRYLPRVGAERWNELWSLTSLLKDCEGALSHARMQLRCVYMQPGHLVMGCSIRLLCSKWELSPCCRVKYHVCNQRVNIPPGSMILWGHSCSPHPHCNAIVLGCSRPIRPPTLQAVASPMACPSSPLSAMPCGGLWESGIGLRRGQWYSQVIMIYVKPEAEKS